MLTLRGVKGSPLTYVEADGNFSGLADGSLIPGGTAGLASPLDGLGDALVAVKLTSTGATARTQHDVNEELDPGQKFFGGTVDGATDDVTAINTTITAKQVVKLNKGTSLCGSSITALKNTSLIGYPQEKIGNAGAQASVIKSSATKAIDLGSTNNGNVILKGFEVKPVTSLVGGSYGIYGASLAYLTAEELVVRNFDTGIYFDSAQQYALSKIRVTGCNAGIRFATSAINVTMDNMVSAGSLTGPNLDYLGKTLYARVCDFSNIPPSGTRAAVRVRAGSRDATFENCYFEVAAGHATGGNIYQIEGGVTRIVGGFVDGGQDAGHEVGNVISASGGAIVIVEGLTGFDYFTNLVTADGAGTIVYVMPGAFTGSFVASGGRYNETNGGKVILVPDQPWTDVAFSAGNFTGGASLTWTLAAGDQTAYSYVINGKTMTVTWYLQNTTTGGTADGRLQIAIPAGKTATKRVFGTCSYNQNGTRAIGVCDVLASGTVIRLGKDIDFNTTWSNALTDSLAVAGSITFEIT